MGKKLILSDYYVFTSGVEQYNSIDLNNLNQEELIKNETMLFSADFDFAYSNGNSLTKAFLDQLDKTKNWIIDSRVHMLMKGWYPCIPGWHHDDVPRSLIDGQPNYESPEYEADHVIMILGDCSRTEFLKANLGFKKVELNKVVYNEWNIDINKHLDKAINSYKDKTVVQLESGKLYKFNCYDFHRGVPATKSGWRFFIRASTNTKRIVKNEIRRQVQAYPSNLEGGW